MTHEFTATARGSADCRAIPRDWPAVALAGLLLAPLAMLPAHPAAAASFDCTKAGTAVEKMICADAELSKLDEALGEEYARVLAQAADQKTLKTQQRAWLRDTRDACADEVCVKAAYEARIGKLAKAGGAIDEDELFRHGRPAGMYSLAEDNDPRVCGPLFQSLNSPWDAKRQLGPLIFMRNDYLIQPWENRKYLWRLRPADKAKTHNLEVAFLDLNGDGKEDAIFRQTGLVREFVTQIAFLLRSVDLKIKEDNPLDESLMREIIQKNNINFANFDNRPHKNRQLIELVELNDKIYILIGRAFYWTLDDDPRKPKVQLLELNEKQLERLCIFEGTREIVQGKSSQ